MAPRSSAEARLKEEIEGLLERAGAVDGEEDERYGEEMRGDELPAELQRREKRLAAIAAAKARLEAAQRAGDDARGRTPGQGRNPKGGRPYKRAYGEPEPKAQSNFTDPESRIMRDAVPRRMMLAWAEFATLRQRLLKIGARVVEKAARIRIHFASACPDAALFRMLAGRLAASGP